MGVLVMNLDDLSVYGNAFDILHDTFTVTGSGILGEDKILVTGTIDNKLALWMIKHNLVDGMNERVFNFKKPRSGVDVLGLPSTDIVLMGTEEEESGTDVFLMKLTSDGTVSTEENIKPVNISVYPNPATDKLWIKSSATGLQHAEVIILNSMGKIVKTALGLNDAIAVNTLPQGFYVVMVVNNNKIVFRQKFVKY
jgi:hypothetical protein